MRINAGEMGIPPVLQTGKTWWLEEVHTHSGHSWRSNL
jgi:hypothetical protein